MHINFLDCAHQYDTWTDSSSFFLTSLLQPFPSRLLKVLSQQTTSCKSRQITPRKNKLMPVFFLFSNGPDKGIHNIHFISSRCTIYSLHLLSFLRQIRSFKCSQTFFQVQFFFSTSFPYLVANVMLLFLHQVRPLFPRVFNLHSPFRCSSLSKIAALDYCTKAEQFSTQAG